jgi:hypothetical protein
MSISKEALLKAAVVSVVLAVIAALISGVLFSSYVAYSTFAEPYALYGLEAARLYISEFGIFRFLVGLWGYFTIILV